MLLPLCSTSILPVKQELIFVENNKKRHKSPWRTTSNISSSCPDLLAITIITHILLSGETMLQNRVYQTSIRILLGNAEGPQAILAWFSKVLTWHNLHGRSWELTTQHLWKSSQMWINALLSWTPRNYFYFIIKTKHLFTFLFIIFPYNLVGEFIWVQKQQLSFRNNKFQFSFNLSLLCFA